MELVRVHSLTSFATEKVRNIPEWCSQSKPYCAYPETSKMHSSAEFHYLYDVPKRLGSGNYANLGTFRGTSAACLAFGMRDAEVEGKVYAVDLWEGHGDENRLYPERLQNHFEDLELSKYLKVCKGSTEVWATALSKLVTFRFVFIDASHDYLSVKADFELWSRLLDADGEIAFHDSDLSTVAKVIQELDESWRQVKNIFRIKAFRKCKV